MPAPDLSPPPAPSERLQNCHEQYLLHFVGQPRLTRELDVLARLIDQLQALQRDLLASPAAAVAEACADRVPLQHEVAARIEAMRAEYAAIGSAQQQAGVGGMAAARLSQQMGFVMHRYLRHFAGQPRMTRDVGLLREIVADLGALLPPLDRLAADDAHAAAPAAAVRARAALHRSLQQLEGEVAAIFGLRLPPSLRQPEAAGQSGPKHIARAHAAALAQAATTLFATYNVLVVGRPRLAVRPELLARLVADQTTLVHAMQGLVADGFDDAGHRENCDIIAAHLAAWQQEYDDTLALRRQHSLDEVAQALAEEADVVLTTFNDTVAARPFTVAQRNATGLLCDRMDELRRQIQAVPQVFGHAHHAPAAAFVADAQTLLNMTFEGHASPPPPDLTALPTAAAAADARAS